MRVRGLGGPRRVLDEALRALAREGVQVLAQSPVINSAAVGPSTRRYANSAALVQSGLSPPDFLRLLQRVEQHFGRGRAQRRGQRWRARMLDLDIVLWSGGVWFSRDLIIPHREMRHRDFVLGPACVVAGDWRDPVSAIGLRPLYARLKRPQKRA